MRSFLSPSGLALSLLAITTAVQASPINLVRRMEINYVDCSATRKSKLQSAFADAASLALNAYDMDQSSTAFKHYLRAEDAAQANKLWSMAAANNDPTNAPYTFSVRCAKTCTGGEKNSLAITDSTPGKNDGSYPEMKICPLFFTAAETKNRLNSKSYEKDADGGWCKSGQPFKAFETGGHTLLHEMTHLDALGKGAGMPERDLDDGSSKTHGTDDVVDFGDDYITAARDLLSTWVNNPDDLAEGALAPYQNAENIAAAATENWFIKQCGFEEITLDG